VGGREKEESAGDVQGGKTDCRSLLGRGEGGKYVWFLIVGGEKKRSRIADWRRKKGKGEQRGGGVDLATLILRRRLEREPLTSMLWGREEKRRGRPFFGDGKG